MITKTAKLIVAATVILILAFESVSAVSLSGEGYGGTLNDAKANALADLLSKISVSVESNTEARVSDNSANSQQSYSRSTSLSSNLTLMFVRYEVSESTTKSEKASGKYKCIAEISDKDKDQCIRRASELVFEIDRIFSALSLETDLRSRRAYCDALQKRFDEYDSCFLTARLLNYSDLVPAYSAEINPDWISVEIKKTEEAILKAGLSGTMDDTTTEGLEDLLLNKLWDNSKSSTAAMVTTSTSEGVYSKEYKVGNFGPAGGIVFYDKGEYSNGWRYLEVASQDISGKFIYGKNGKLNTGIKLGTGKDNTAQIIALNGTSLSYAALACSKYSEGGYTDWYLPSKEELELIYSKLNGNKNLTMVKDGYWSSSQLNSSYAYGFSFKTKKSFTDSESSQYRVRAVRSF